jgi:hypothetical protein
MSRRGARLSVAVLFALSIGAAAWQYVRAERALGSHHTQTAAFEREARALALGIAELRASEQAYVAVGQGTDYWVSRVTHSIESLKARLSALRQQARSPEAVTRLDAAAESLDDFSRMDRRAREYATTGQRLLASDLIFADGFEMTQAVALDLDAGRAMEMAYRNQNTARLENDKRLLAAGVAGVGLLFMLILASAPATRPRVADSAAPRPTYEAPVPVVAETPAPPMAAEPAATLPAPVDLNLAAELCLDLARVSDTQQIPSLLERAARVLDASGIIVWIADPDARELVPTLSHGYAAAAIARVGSIPSDADNATAAAFREARVHIVEGDTLTNGAIVAPLVTPGGCMGVIAAEVRHERELSPEVRAVAAIVAAQLASLIGVAPAANTQQARAN